MKKTLSFLVMAILALSVMPSVFAVSVGGGIGIDIQPEEFAPLIWQCDSRLVLEDCVEAGRTTDCNQDLYERITNYAFEGEQIGWEILVMDKNKIEEIEDVVGTIGSSQGTGNDIEVECDEIATEFDDGDKLPVSCEARIGEEKLTTFDSDTMGFYRCLFTVETPDSMAGEYFLTAEVISVDGEAIMAENEYWFLNPVIALTVDGDVEFAEVRQGSVAYSNTILVGNDAEAGSGVLLDMFISGTDFYDSDTSGAMCPSTNHLKLSQDLRSQANLGAKLTSGPSQSTKCNAGTGGLTGVDNNDHLCYFATSGAYSTAGAPNADVEGYRPIVYSDAFTRDFYNDAEIIWNGALTGGYSAGNTLTPGSEIAMTFKLGLPEPCVGNFDSGDIFFWGEAI